MAGSGLPPRLDQAAGASLHTAGHIINDVHYRVRSFRRMGIPAYERRYESNDRDACGGDDGIDDMFGFHGDFEWLNGSEFDRSGFFPALVPGGESLHGVGLELVVAAESGIEAVEARGLRRGYRVDQFLRDYPRQGYEDQAVRYGPDRDSGHFYDPDLFRWGNSGLEKYFRKQVVLGSRGVEMVGVEVELEGDLVFGGIRRQFLPAFEIRRGQFHDAESAVLGFLVPVDVVQF